MTQQEYIDYLQKYLPGKMPPCVICPCVLYEQCRDEEMDCKAFRHYTENIFELKEIGESIQDIKKDREE